MAAAKIKTKKLNQTQLNFEIFSKLMQSPYTIGVAINLGELNRRKFLINL